MATRLIKPYIHEANRMRVDKSLLFPSTPPGSQDARMILHPPGYSVLLLAVGDDGSDQTHTAMRWLQITCDSLSAALVLLIAAEFFPLAVAVIAGMLVAFSPHLTHYSLWLTPETLAVLPVLLAIYLVARAIKRPRLWMMIAAGMLVGWSCWLRANGLLLALFLAIAVFFVIERRKRLLYSASLVAAMILTISPITIRNWATYHRFVPLSLGAGITMVEGIADFDDENRFAMPIGDGEVLHKDAEWHNRPDYAGNIWVPDGVERDRERLRRGLEVIRSNPTWFAGVMIRRAAFMLRYNDSLPPGAGYFSPNVPVISKEPGFGYQLADYDAAQPVWSSSAAELKMSGTCVTARAAASLSADEQTLQITGDDSEFGDQFVSAPISVEANTDYVLRLQAKLLRGRMAAKVTSIDRRIALASALIGEPEKKIRRKARIDYESRAGISADDSSEKPASENESSMTLFEMPFATGNRNEVLLVISNDGPSAARRMVEVGGAQLYPMGPTPAIWTRAVRPPVRAIQRNLYTTTRMLPLIAIGIGLLALAGRKRALVVLLCVPAYYLLAQSAFHTEYRYILAIHYFLFILAGVTLFCAGKLTGQIARRIISAVKRSRAEAAL